MASVFQAPHEGENACLKFKQRVKAENVRSRTRLQIAEQVGPLGGSKDAVAPIFLERIDSRDFSGCPTLDAGVTTIQIRQMSEFESGSGANTNLSSSRQSANISDIESHRVRGNWAMSS